MTKLVRPFDPLRLLWVRFTYCRQWGHHPWPAEGYCRNCGQCLAARRSPHVQD